MIDLDLCITFKEESLLPLQSDPVKLLLQIHVKLVSDTVILLFPHSSMHRPF